MTVKAMLGAGIFCLCALVNAPVVDAANAPCSGKKGGIARCQGDTFICNDGSVSASKRSCLAYTGGGPLGFMGSSNRSSQMTPSAGASCSCREGNYCTGPRGGRYCLTDSGNKSYLRK